MNGHAIALGAAIFLADNFLIKLVNYCRSILSCLWNVADKCAEIRSSVRYSRWWTNDQDPTFDWLVGTIFTGPYPLWYFKMDGRYFPCHQHLLLPSLSLPPNLSLPFCRGNDGDRAWYRFYWICSWIIQKKGRIWLWRGRLVATGRVKRPVRALYTSSCYCLTLRRPSPSIQRPPIATGHLIFLIFLLQLLSIGPVYVSRLLFPLCKEGFRSFSRENELHLMISSRKERYIKSLTRTLPESTRNTVANSKMFLRNYEEF